MYGCITDRKSYLSVNVHGSILKLNNKIKENKINMIIVLRRYFSNISMLNIKYPETLPRIVHCKKPT